MPLVAVVVQRFAGARRGRLLLLAALLMTATAAGVGAGARGVAALPGAEGWLPALVGGLLLHVMGHSIQARPPGSRGERLAEIAALVAGVGLPMALVVGHDADPGHAGLALVSAVAGLGLQAAPALLVGLLVAAAVGWDARLAAGARGRAGWVAAAVFALPALGLDALLVSIGFLGPRLAAARLLLALVAAAAGGLALARASRARDTPAAPLGVPRGWAALDAALLRLGPWMAASLVLAALVQRSVAPEQLAAAADLRLDWLAAAVAGAAPMHAVAAMPVVGALLAKGLSPALALLVLVLGPGLSLPALGLLSARHGARAAGVGVATFLAVSLIGALLWAAVGGDAPPPAPPLPGAAPVGSVCAVALLVLGARSVWLAGPRAWAAGLAGTHGVPAPPEG